MKRPSEDPALPVRASPPEAERVSASADIEPDLYSETAVDHFTHPRNVGGLDDADGTGSDTNPSCGDRTRITIQIRGGRIAEARFRTFGCVAAIASASLLTELVRGRPIEEARAVAPGDVIAALGGLPARKEGCALMAVGALRAALLDAEVRAEARA